jgi:hypothetical protein
MVETSSPDAKCFIYLLLIGTSRPRIGIPRSEIWDTPFEKYEYGAQNRADLP